MRQYESCAGACRERRLQLVSGGGYDELMAAAAACRVRLEGLWTVVGGLARTEPGPGEWRAAYEAVRQSARSALRRLRPAAGGGGDELLSPAETVIIWRCQDCGGVDAPRECIDVCIWGPADWVDAAWYESERSRAAVDREVEQSLAGLLRRFAFATPRDGQWERSWRAFQSQARLALRSGNHAALRTRWSSGRLKPMDNASLLAPGIRSPSPRPELQRVVEMSRNSYGLWPRNMRDACSPRGSDETDAGPPPEDATVLWDVR